MDAKRVACQGEHESRRSKRLEIKKPCIGSGVLQEGTMSTRLVTHKLLGVLTAALGLLAASDAFATGPYGAGPSRQWLDGAIGWTYHNNCLTGAVETETGQYVGWVGNMD